jgi:hypothetical protein
MRVRPISGSLPGEHLAATSPVMRPETDDARWRLRLDFWAGRALTADALELEQENRAARLAWRGRLATPGIVTGLEVAIEPPAEAAGTLTPAGHFIHILPGHGLLADGEDVVVPRPLRVALDRIPVHYVRVVGPDSEDPEPVPAGATAGEPRDAGGFVLNVDTFEPGHAPWAAVLVLAPAEFRTFERVIPEDPCELDPSQDAFADERRLDAFVVRLVQLPVRLESLPELANRDNPRWRNVLAHAVLDEQARRSPRQQIRFRQPLPAGRRWDTIVRETGIPAWERSGLWCDDAQLFPRSRRGGAHRRAGAAANASVAGDRRRGKRYSHRPGRGDAVRLARRRRSVRRAPGLTAHCDRAGDHRRIHTLPVRAAGGIPAALGAHLSDDGRSGPAARATE